MFAFARTMIGGERGARENELEALQIVKLPLDRGESMYGERSRSYFDGLFVSQLSLQVIAKQRTDIV